MPPSQGEAARHTPAEYDTAIWAIAIAVFALLQFFAAKEASGKRLFSSAPTNYYHYATDALLSGQLSLKVAPRSELLSLSDPYDPALNQPYRLHDVSLYHGKYYFYWGQSPVVLFFAPIRIITGLWASESLAAAFFGVVCLAALFWVMLAVRRLYFPMAGYSTAILALLCLAACSFLTLLAANNHVYGVPISCAAACYAVAWWAALRGIIEPSRSAQWGLVCGVALAFTLGARPNYLLWTPAFLFVLFAVIRLRPESAWTITLAAAVPVLLAVACLLLLNQMRFGDPLEFGVKYQLTGSKQVEGAFGGIRYLSANWKSYGWNPLHVDRYFPFLTSGSEAPFGVFSALPVAWLACGLACAGAASRKLRGWSWGLSLSCALSFAAACLYPSAVLRYMVDFLPGIVLAGGLCALALDHRFGGRPLGRWSCGALLFASAVIGGLLQVQSWSVSRPARVQALRPLARLLNAPVFAWETMHSPPSGGERIVVRFPKGHTGAFEPILGVPAEPIGGELVFVHYVDAGHVRLGFFQTGTTHWLSEPIAADYSATHVLDVRLGSLPPPDSHPAFSQWPEFVVQAALSQVDISLDDRSVYHTALDFGSSHSVQVQVGQNKVAPGASGPTFSGDIISSQPLPLSPPEPPMQGSWMKDPIDFTFSMFPSPSPPPEEVFFTALDSAFLRTTLEIRHLPGSRIRFVFRSGGRPDIEGPPMEASVGGNHRLLLSVGPWLADAPVAQRSRIEVRMDDAVALSGSIVGHMDIPDIALAGRSDSRASPALAPFDGYIADAIPVPVSAISMTPSARDRLFYGAWLLKVRFPSDAPPGYHDPLLVSGVAGKGDFIYAFYPGPGKVAFSHDSWGYGGETSPAVAVDLNIEHVIEIEHGGLFPPQDDPAWEQVPQGERTDRKSRLRVRLDGVVVLDAVSHANDASPISITPGINSIGGSSTGPKFLGRILSAGREGW